MLKRKRKKERKRKREEKENQKRKGKEKANANANAKVKVKAKAKDKEMQKEIVGDAPHRTAPHRTAPLPWGGVIPLSSPLLTPSQKHQISREEGAGEGKEGKVRNRGGRERGR